VICASLAIAEGPPVDSLGRVFCKHRILKLTQQQIKEAGTKRHITFTNEQWRSFHNKQYPPKIYVLTPTWAECCCGMFYAIWNKPDQVCISQDMIDWADFSDREITNVDSSNYNDVNIDINGDMYYHYNKINISKVDSFIDDVVKIKKNKSFRFFTIFRPPRVSKVIDNKVMDILTEVRRYCEKKEVNFRPY